MLLLRFVASVMRDLSCSSCCNRKTAEIIVVKVQKAPKHQLILNHPNTMTSSASGAPPMPQHEDSGMEDAMITAADGDAVSSGTFLPPAPNSPHHAPIWNSAPNTPAYRMSSSPPHPPLSPTGRHHAVHHNIIHHHPQRPLSTYTTLGSPRSQGRVRSASMGNAPYQQKVLPNPQASSAMFLPLGANANPQPPELSNQRKAMEAASAAERTRAKELEEAESTMDADELRAVLKKERHRTAKIQADLAALRSGTVQQQFQAEVLEEGRINGLMRRMDDLQEEKGRIILELEREEEMVCKTDDCKVPVVEFWMNCHLLLTNLAFS